MNSSLFSAKHACTCETAVLENSQLFFRFPPKKNGKKGNPRTAFSALKFSFGYFHVSMQI